MSSSPDNSQMTHNEIYPFVDFSQDPYLTVNIDGDEKHSNPIFNHEDSIHISTWRYPLEQQSLQPQPQPQTPIQLSENSLKPIHQSYIKQHNPNGKDSMFINTCEIFPDFDPELVQIHYKNDYLVGIDNLRNDEGIDTENDDAKRENYYNENLNTSDNETEEESFAFTLDVNDNTISSGFTGISSKRYLQSITNWSDSANRSSGSLKKPLRRISTPNFTPTKPVICNQRNCHKTFINKNDYKKHLKSHTILTFQCPYHLSMQKHKGKHIFTRMDVWKRHLRTFHFEFDPEEDSNQGLGNCRICGDHFKYFNIFADEHIEDCAKRQSLQNKLF